MHLTLYTDYTLRVMMYLAVKHSSQQVATIDEMATAYDIPRSHLTKIVNELARNGFIETTRGRAGGARLSRLPEQISIGSLVRMAEKDFAVVQCHSQEVTVGCAILPACNLRNGLRRAVEAFLFELDKMTLKDAVIAPSVAASLLRISAPQLTEVSVPVSVLSAGNRRAATRTLPATRSPPPKKRLRS